MCNWNENTQRVFDEVVRSLDGEAFDALRVRDLMRAQTAESIVYGDVVPELWHAFRKKSGPFSAMQRYVLRTVEREEGVTPEYVPAEGTVLKKILRRWDRA